MQRAFVLVNPAARGGKGVSLWNQISPLVRETVEPLAVHQDLEGVWRRDLHQAIESGVRVVIAAGGDGTVHALLQGLVEQAGERPLSDFSIGGVGIGSSNDFHKPFQRVEKGIPIRVNAGQGTPRDVGLVRYGTPEGREEKRFFFVSASMGLTAEGNHFFNTGGGFFRWLKGRQKHIARPHNWYGRYMNLRWRYLRRCRHRSLHKFYFLWGWLRP